MPIIVRQILLLLARQFKLKVLGTAFLLHFILFWSMLYLTEEPGSAILEPANYWYFWVTTSTSIGYGDLSPQSIGARTLAPFFQVSGIAIVTILITMVIQTLVDHSSKRRRGLMPTNKSGHILVLGDYHPVKTKSLIQNAAADIIDDGRKAIVVGCFRNTGEKNPFDRHSDYPDFLPDYIQVGDGGFNRQSLLDAGAHTAAQIYISAADDALSIGIVGFLSRLNCSARVVLLLHEEASTEGIPDTNLDLHVIPPVQSLLAVREMGDPGTGAAVIELLSTGGSTIYSIALTEASTYRIARAAFEGAFGHAILLGYCSQDDDREWVSNLVVADQEAALRKGDRLIYMAGKDLTSVEEELFATRLKAQ